MAQVTKTIRGQKYYYFQNSVKVDGKNITVTTCIARTDTEPQELLQAKSDAFSKHLIKLLKHGSLIKKTQYRFEQIPTTEKDEIYDSFEYLKLLYSEILKSITPQEKDDFEKTMFTKYVHGTTAIEGNTLSEQESFRLLSANLTPNNKTLNETLEVANYIQVRNFVQDYRYDVTERMIKHIHRLLMAGIIGENGKPIKAGEYRDSQAILKNIDFIPSTPTLIPEKMRYVLAEYQTMVDNNIHPLERITIFHQKFEEIHPFQDGNGRAGREILNFMLKQSGYPQIYITPSQRSEYLKALQDGNAGNHVTLFEFIVSRMAATMSYLYSKTQIYSQLLSSESEKMAEELGMKDVYEHGMSILNAHRTSVDPP